MEIRKEAQALKSIHNAVGLMSIIGVISRFVKFYFIYLQKRLDKTPYQPYNGYI
jgi:hypothetical protein